MQRLCKDWRLNKSHVGCEEESRTLKERKICQYTVYIYTYFLSESGWVELSVIFASWKRFILMLLEPWGKIPLLAPPPPLQGGQRSWSGAKQHFCFSVRSDGLWCSEAPINNLTRPPSCRCDASTRASLLIVERLRGRIHNLKKAGLCGAVSIEMIWMYTTAVNVFSILLTTDTFILTGNEWPASF